jgi:penicillin G amidase
MQRTLLRTQAVVIPLVLALCTQCSESKVTPAVVSDATTGDSAVVPDDGGLTEAAAPPVISPYESVKLDQSVAATQLTAYADAVRDENGIPHIFAPTLADASYAQGYMMARDRWLQMDLGRRQAGGTLTEILGKLNPAVYGVDIRYRTHHLRRQAETTFNKLKASTDPADQDMVQILERFTAGINAWQADLFGGKYKLPDQVTLVEAYTNESVKPWSPIDSLMLGELQAFELAFDGENDIARTLAAAGDTASFKDNANPVLASRAGFAQDYFRFAPVTPTYTVDGWSETTFAANGQPAKTGPSSPLLPNAPGGMLRKGVKRTESQHASLDFMRRAKESVRDIGRSQRTDPDRGSNNWVVGSKLTASGNAMLANDTHLSLGNPATFYLNHITTADGVDVMGVQFPGIPLVVLGMNRNLAWGGTVNFSDVTDIYSEQVVDCAAKAGAKCVQFQGKEVELTTREETFSIGGNGKVDSTRKVTYYEVPHHGPIAPELDTATMTNKPLGNRALSIKYTGYEPGPLLRTLYELARAKVVDDGVKAVENYFYYGGQNWVFADTKGNIGWAQASRVPKRPKGSRPWLVMPGDGSAEWQGFFEAKDLPRAKNPAKGYLVTANADPLGLTKDNTPADQPEVGGFPKYIGIEYEPGSRVDRSTKRVVEATSGGKKMDLEAMSAAQGDVVSTYAAVYGPELLAALKAIQAESATPGAHPELATLIAGASAQSKATVDKSIAALTQWTSFALESGVTNDLATPTAKQKEDAKAALLAGVFAQKFSEVALGDELAVLKTELLRNPALRMGIELLRNPNGLITKDRAFDDIRTPEVETRLQTLAKAAFATLDRIIVLQGADPDAWAWGKSHTVSPTFPLPLGLNLPTYARPGGNGTVDAAGYRMNDEYKFTSGPAIRFVCELDPVKGPIARNILPGGIIFDPDSPHFRDMYTLWLQNKTVALPFNATDVVTSAAIEVEKNKLGRTRFAK